MVNETSAWRPFLERVCPVFLFNALPCHFYRLEPSKGMYTRRSLFLFYPRGGSLYRLSHPSRGLSLPVTSPGPRIPGLPCRDPVHWAAWAGRWRHCRVCVCFMAFHGWQGCELSNRRPPVVFGFGCRSRRVIDPESRGLELFISSLPVRDRYF